MKKTKARKQHVCDCGNHISRGEYYYRLKMRIPREDENEIQVGIEYIDYIYCSACYEELTGPPDGMTEDEYSEYLDRQDCT